MRKHYPFFIVFAAMLAGVAYAQMATDAGPASQHVAITPSDSTSLVTNGVPLCRALVVTEAGDVEITDQAGVEITYPSVPAYTVLPIKPALVGAGTTATVVCWRN
jgi:hypothetical protein